MPSGRNRGDLGYVAFNVPIGRKAQSVHNSNRQAACPAHDSRQLPATNNSVQDSADSCGEAFSLADRKIPYVIRIYLMPHIEVGIAVEFAGVPGVNDLSVVIEARHGKPLGLRGPIEGLGIGVVKIRLQTETKALAINDFKGVEAGTSHRTPPV